MSMQVLYPYLLYPCFVASLKIKGIIKNLAQKFDKIDKKFFVYICYLDDMLNAGGGAESSTGTRVRSGWERFRELLPLLTTKAISLKVKGELYAACIMDLKTMMMMMMMMIIYNEHPTKCVKNLPEKT